MPIERKDAEKLARGLISEVASEWKETLFTTCFEENGAHIFVFTLPPGDLGQDGNVVDRPKAISSLQFNPLAEVTEIVIACYVELENKSIGDDEFRRTLAYDNAKRWTLRMLDITTPIFQDAMWHSRLIAHTLLSVQVMKAFGRTDVVRELINSTVEHIDEKVRSRLGRIIPKRNPKISDFKINTALRIFLPEFRESGKIPSQNKFAKELGVTAKAWRTYLSNKNHPRHDVAMKQWLQELVDRYPK